MCFSCIIYYIFLLHKVYGLSFRNFLYHYKFWFLLIFNGLITLIVRFEDSFKISVVWDEDFMCKTNLPLNTAFRGFRGFQDMYTAKCILQDVANYLRKDSLFVSEFVLPRWYQNELRVIYKTDLSCKTNFQKPGWENSNRRDVNW